MRQREATILPEWKITVWLPGTLCEAAWEKARRTKRSLNRLIADAVQREVEQPEAIYETERERTLRVLKESGLLDEPEGQPSLSADAVQRELEQPGAIYETEHERVMAVLKESGLLSPLGPEWDEMLSGKPILSHEEILKMMAGQRPLSEDIIEMRGEL